MANVLVKARPGRVAYTAMRGGQLIPQDRQIAVPDSPWIRKLADKHGDIEIAPMGASRPPLQAPQPARRPTATVQVSADTTKS